MNHSIQGKNIDNDISYDFVESILKKSVVNLQSHSTRESGNRDRTIEVTKSTTSNVKSSENIIKQAYYVEYFIYH
jgi:hypothetical protein